MKSRMRKTSRRWTTRALAILGVLTVSAVAFAAPALAHDRRGHARTQADRGGHGHHNHQRHDVRHRDFGRHVRHVVVPRRIQARHLRVYEPYFSGRVFYPDHRHHHAVYLFPVRTRSGVVFRRHVYCRGELFPGAHFSYDGPGVSVRVRY